jgi:hypothetical protein
MVTLPDSTVNLANTVVSRDENGDFSAGTITANNFVGNGIGLTSLNAANVSGVLGTTNIPNLDASKITSGTLDNARLSNNVALRTGGNFFAGNQFVTNGFVGIGTTSPQQPLQVGDLSVPGSQGIIRLA